MKHKYFYSYDGISLIPMEWKESKEYRLLRNKPENRAGFIYTGEISLKEQEMWYREYLNRKGDYMFAVYDEACMFLGGCGIYNVAETAKTAEFGRILIDKKMSGGGYGYRTVMAAVNIAGKYLGINELVLHVKKTNIPAIKIYKKAGFVIDMHDRKDVLKMIRRIPKVW